MGLTDGAYRIALNNKNKLPDKIMVTGTVNTHVRAMVLMVPFCKFFNPFFATIDPAMPDDSI
jgi:hypothetical protein